MLDLALHPKRGGNSSSKIYPHEGRLGVTPVIIGGLIVVKPSDDEIKFAVAAKTVSIVIKCIESRNFGSSEERILWEKTKVFWKPQEGEYESMSAWSGRFSISIPVDAMEKAKSAQLTKDWTVQWKLSLIVHHRPIPLVGSNIMRTYFLNVFDHTSPFVPPPSPPQAMSVGNDAYSSQVHINPPHGAFGPGDTFPVSFNVKPDDPSTIVKKATICLERRYETRERSRSPSPPKSEKSSIFRISPRPIMSRLSSGETSDKPEKVVTHKLYEAAVENLTQSSGGTFWASTMFNLPRRTAAWDIGETCTTDLIKLSFTIQVKLWVKSGRSTKEIVCPGVPIILTAVSAAERSIALKEAEAANPCPTHKRKHISSRRGLYMQEGTVELHEDSLSPSSTRRSHTKTKPKSIKSSASSLKSAPSSPILPISGVVTDIRPILRQADQPAFTSPPPLRGPSISFVFPHPHSPQIPTHTQPMLPTIQSLLDAPPPPYESYSVMKDFQQNGRRVSSHTTTSEEDEQPSRSRQRLALVGGSNQEFDYRRGLPSLDALGLGLPVLPDDGRPRSRPRTAPLVSTFSRNIPPPLSGKVSTETGSETSQVRPMSMATIGDLPDRASRGSFAFAPPNPTAELATAPPHTLL